MKQKKIILLLCTLLIAAVLALPFWKTAASVFLRNRLALQTARGLLAGAPLPDASRFSALAEDCRASWLLGFLEHQGEPRPTLNASWQRAIRCNPQRVELLAALFADDLDFARQVNAAQPNNAEGWFWVAGLVSADQPQEALEYYRRGLAIDPGDSRRWTYVGDLLTEVEDLSGALEAYLMACKTGDAGANGCLRAGGTAEKMGDFHAAIRYYRMSHFSGAWERAERLEKLLQGQP
jgi:tetratricopeptide (TPR) repeat protein